MLFTSPVFLFLFLPVVFVLYHLSPLRLKNPLLLLVSLFFYAWGETIYVLLMLLSVTANYALGLLIAKSSSPHRAKLMLGAGIAANLGMLIAFKYANFLVDNGNVLLAAIGLPPLELQPVHLPLGISFFTFQAMSYVIDVYRKEAVAQTRFTNIALYIALFPQLIAGPIVRYHDVARQLLARDHASGLIVSGIRRFLLGMSKKMLVANPLGAVADEAFSMSGGELSTPLAWFGIICYALQIYFDFSGYSDMAIGLGRMFGFRFLENFNYPYIAQSLQDFWRRWHISLSGWFRDYLYIPLGGNRLGNLRTGLNLFLVFFLCGLWHGASWNFVVWGLIHGLFLVLERLGLNNLLRRSWRPLRHLYVLLVVCIAWVFFRAETLSGALDYLAAMFALGGTEAVPGQFVRFALAPEVLIAFVLGLVFMMPVYPRLVHLFLIPATVARPALYPVTQGLMISGLFVLSSFAVASTTYNPFIYFRF